MVKFGLTPAPATYKSLLSQTELQEKRTIKKSGMVQTTNSFPMLMGRPFAPRSPRPRILEPVYTVFREDRGILWVVAHYRLLRRQFAHSNHQAKSIKSCECVLYVQRIHTGLLGDAIYRSNLSMRHRPNITVFKTQDARRTRGCSPSGCTKWELFPSK